jgi:hypothetical protein
MAAAPTPSPHLVFETSDRDQAARAPPVYLDTLTDASVTDGRQALKTGSSMPLSAWCTAMRSHARETRPAGGLPESSRDSLRQTHSASHRAHPIATNG